MAIVRACPPVPLSSDRLGGRTPDFACAVEMAPAPGLDPYSLRWARAAWEGSPAALRWFLVAGWRFVLGLRLGPLDSPGHVLGWSIEQADPDETICHQASWFLEAYNAFRVSAGGVTWTTTVLYRHPMARVIWPPVSLLHRPLVRLCLAGAAKRIQRQDH